MSSTSTILVCGPSEGKVAVAAAICNYSRLVQRRRDGEGSDVCLPLPASGAPVLGGAFVEHSMELHSAWGTFEWLIEDCFRLGYRVGVVCNSDGHKGRPGSSYPGASTFGALTT